MTDQIQHKINTGEARIVAPPVARPNAPRHQVEIDRNFELPTGMFAMTVGLYLGFLAIMAAAFGNPVLAIPMAIFALFIVAGFGVPAVWSRLAGNKSKPLTMARFKADGIMTGTGRLTSRDATVQMLILPGLLVAWGATFAIIAAIL